MSGVCGNRLARCPPAPPAQCSPTSLPPVFPQPHIPLSPVSPRLLQPGVVLLPQPVVPPAPSSVSPQLPQPGVLLASPACYPQLTQPGVSPQPGIPPQPRPPPSPVSPSPPKPTPTPAPTAAADRRAWGRGFIGNTQREKAPTGPASRSQPTSDTAPVSPGIPHHRGDRASARHRIGATVTAASRCRGPAPSPQWPLAPCLQLAEASSYSGH